MRRPGGDEVLSCQCRIEVFLLPRCPDPILTVHDAWRTPETISHEDVQSSNVNAQ